MGLSLFKSCFAGLIFGGGGGGLLLVEILRFIMVGLDNKNRLKHYENSLKQLKTLALTIYSPWAYIREGLSSEGFCVWVLWVTEVFLRHYIVTIPPKAGHDKNL